MKVGLASALLTQSFSVNSGNKDPLLEVVQFLLVIGTALALSMLRMLRLVEVSQVFQSGNILFQDFRISIQIQIIAPASPAHDEGGSSQLGGN